MLNPIEQWLGSSAITVDAQDGAAGFYEKYGFQRHGRARQLFDEVNQWLSEASVVLKEGLLVDATNHRSYQFYQKQSRRA